MMPITCGGRPHRQVSTNTCVHPFGGPFLIGHLLMDSPNAAAVCFLDIAFERNDWVALLLKSFESGEVRQRVGPVAWARSDRCQRWLRAMNSHRFDVYVSVNAISAGQRTRTREAMGAVRHVFLEADENANAVLAGIDSRVELPAPSYVLESSPSRLHLFWRAAGFEHSHLERLQKQLARELRTDTAATPVTQTTRLPGFWNYKRTEPHVVTIQYRDCERRFWPDDFPAVTTAPPAAVSQPAPRIVHAGVVERARRYLQSTPPAVSGQHGDVHTFRVCCRLVRGFALDDDEALTVLAEWNQRCKPPWTTAELTDKLRRASRYGREAVGGLL